MKIIADLHLHSAYSRATSKNLNLEHLAKWAQIKGIDIVGTGDFVHPAWLKEMQEKLEPAEPGLFKLKEEYGQTTQREVPAACVREVRFMLSVEISNIYKRLEKVRKVHNVLFAPSFEAALAIQAKLDAIGNIRSDGRPILGLDSRDLLEITLEADDHAFLVPAHIWTPWFSALGSKGGFDKISDCYGDLTDQIFAVETGLSSDPLMNWRLSQLDPYVLISNSDAHSPQKLGREATVFDTELSYYAMYDAMKNHDNPGLVSTIEFFPEEGKYHYDGHRKCDMRMHPKDTIANDGNCPVCGKPVVVGVMARVEELADREEGAKSARWRPYFSLIPLPEIISDAVQKGPATKTINAIYEIMLNKLGNEMAILQDMPLEDITPVAGPVISEGIRRMRTGEVNIAAGYDGEFGVIKLFRDEERKELAKQAALFTGDVSFAQQSKKKEKNEQRSIKCVDDDGNGPSTGETQDEEEETGNVRNYMVQFHQDQHQHEKSKLTRISDSDGLSRPLHTPEIPDLHLGNQLPKDVNAAQWRAVTHMGGHLLIIAGPGTGKTHTLTYRIAHIAQCFAAEDDILALTFTNRAADEMQERLRQRMPDEVDSMTLGTFHSFCLQLLRQFRVSAGLPEKFAVAGPEEIDGIAKKAWPKLSTTDRGNRLEEISLWKSQGLDEQAPKSVQEYDAILRGKGLIDFDDLLLESLKLLRSDEKVLELTRASYRYIFVDEYQDINAAQHALLQLMVQHGVHLTAIGDPNQAIYGFRGADLKYFEEFEHDFDGARILELSENYRSAANILSASCQVMDKAGSSEVPPLTAKIYAQGRLTIHENATDKAEAEYIVHQIEKMVGGTSMFSHDSGRAGSEQEAERSFGDIAVLYRLHTQKNALEEALERSGIPYQIAGEKPLMARHGVSELIAMLRLADNAAINLEAAGRVMQFVVKSMGDKAIEAFEKANADKQGTVMVQDITDYSATLNSASKLGAFLDDIQELQTKLHNNGLIAALQHILVLKTWQEKFAGNAELTANWERLLRIARNRRAFGDFLDYLMLQRVEDEVETQAERVMLLTMHAAKGLEFPVVFIAGCEDNILPLHLDGLKGDAAEERRLFYVGMTRAKSQLYLTHAKKRMLFGKSRELAPSPYLADIEEQLKAYEQAGKIPKRRKKRRDNENQLSLF